VFAFNVLSMAGTGILVSALVGGLLMGYSIPRLIKEYFETIKLVRYSLLTICAMFGIGYLTRYSGLDATLGLALPRPACSTRCSARCWAGWAWR
jgi:lactate permease